MPCAMAGLSLRSVIFGRLGAISGGDAKFTMAVSIVSMWVFRVMLSYFFVLNLGMGLLGVWMGMFIDWFFRDILFGVRFARNRWMDHKVI